MDNMMKPLNAQESQEYMLNNTSYFNEFLRKSEQALTNRVYKAPDKSFLILDPEDVPNVTFYTNYTESEIFQTPQNKPVLPGYLRRIGCRPLTVNEAHALFEKIRGKQYQINNMVQTNSLQKREFTWNDDWKKKEELIKKGDAAMLQALEGVTEQKKYWKNDEEGWVTPQASNLFGLNDHNPKKGKGT